MILGLHCHEKITDCEGAELVFNQLKLIFKPRKESNHQMTTRAKSRGDFRVEMVTTEQQPKFQLSASYKNMEDTTCKYKRNKHHMTQLKKTL